MKGKVLMLFLLILIVSINATEEELHEYLACVFIFLSGFHLLKQHWWISMRGRMFRGSLGIKSVCAVLLVLAAVLTLFSGLLTSRYAFAMLRIKSHQALLIDVHHTAAFIFFLLCSFHFGLHLSLHKRYGRVLLNCTAAGFVMSAGVFLVNWIAERADFFYDFAAVMSVDELIYVAAPVMGCACALWLGVLIDRCAARRLTHV